MIFDRAGQVRGARYVEHRQIYPQPGWVEHDALEIWQRTREVLDGTFEAANIFPREVASIGIANQRETTIVWDRRTGLPYSNAVVWQCTRSEAICKTLLAQGLGPFIRERTGLVVNTYFSGPKLAWLLENVPGLRSAAERGEALFGTVDAWLVWNLTGGPHGGVHVTDVTNASRTMLMDLRRRVWDDDMLRILNIPRAMLPEIRPSSEPATCGAWRYEVDRTSLPVCGLIGDQQAALAGQCCFAAGEAKNTYGTGSFLLMNTGDTPTPSQSGLLSTAAYQLGADGRCQYALEGSIAITGAAIQWLRDNLGLLSSAAESEAVAASVPDAGGIYFVPAFSGLYAPHWDMDARGAIVGLTRYTTRAHLVRATLEAICYQAREVLEAMEADSGVRLQTLKVDGGAVVNNLLMQLQADVLGTRVVRPRISETTALGAAYMAGLASGVWSGTADLQANWQTDRTFEPTWDDSQRARGYRGWQRAVERSRGWVEDEPAAT